MIGNSNSETNSDDPHKLLLTNRKISRLRKTLADTSSANVKLSKPHLSK